MNLQQLMSPVVHYGIDQLGYEHMNNDDNYDVMPITETNIPRSIKIVEAPLSFVFYLLKADANDGTRVNRHKVKTKPMSD